MKQFFNVLILIGAITLFNINLTAQEKVKEIPLKNVQGTEIGNNNESLNQILQRAVNNAKIEALKKAGIEENITSFTNYFQSENNNTYEELFTSDILSDINGAVKNVEIIDTVRRFNKYGQPDVQVTINCIVVKYLSHKDLSFDVFVDGIGMYYPNETKLIFRIKPMKDAYVNMFLFNKTEAYQMFPSNYEKSFILKKDTEYNFPTEAVDYILYTNKKSEPHRMIMVFTKNEIPYTGDIEYKQIIDWIFSIPPDMRIIKSFSFNVVKENKMIE
ncbi:MAG: hypothetical protein KAQ75_00730 [Bacteroidales bacterium]|nr:hypothetical protein [Bacteroidales bacterium]